VGALGDGEIGCCVVYTPPTVSRLPLQDLAGRTKTVPLDSGVIVTARRLGICFGD
jgi:6-phosphofructokinase 1